MFTSVGIRGLFVSTGGERGVAVLRGGLMRTTTLPRIGRGSVVVAGMHRCRTLAQTLSSVREMRRKLRLRLSKSLMDRSLERYVRRLDRVITRKNVASRRALRGVFRGFYVNG